MSESKMKAEAERGGVMGKGPPPWRLERVSTPAEGEDPHGKYLRCSGRQTAAASKQVGQWLPEREEPRDDNWST